MTKKTINQLAKQLREAYTTRTTCPPLRDIIGMEDLASAYAIQEVNNNLLIKNGARIVGRKIGLTSKAVQAQLGVDQPDFGVLLNTMEVLNNDSISMSELMQPTKLQIPLLIMPLPVILSLVINPLN